MGKINIVGMPGDGIGKIVFTGAKRVLETVAKELSPHLQRKGYTYYSPIVGLRQHFNLDICMRPCRSFKENPLNFIRKSKAREYVEPEVDVVIFRQNTEGLYSGVEWSNPPEQVRTALDTHHKMANPSSYYKTGFSLCPKIWL